MSRKPTAKEMKVAKSKIEMNLPKFKRLARDNMVIYFDSLIYKMKCRDVVDNYNAAMNKKIIKFADKEIKGLKEQLKNWKLAYKKEPKRDFKKTLGSLEYLTKNSMSMEEGKILSRIYAAQRSFKKKGKK